MAIEYVQVIESDNETPIELPTEEDGTLMLSTVTAQFPGASGLKYKVSEESKSFRGVKLSNGLLHPPPDEGWNDIIFYCVYPKDNKRKHDDTVEAPSSKVQCLKPAAQMSCTDLIVLSLPYSLTENELKRHFEKYGEVKAAQIKTDRDGKSKGFGFIRFTDYNVQTQVLKKQFDKVAGKLCEVKIPNSKEGFGSFPRVFVDKLTEEMTEKDIKTYFRKFGDIIDIYMPKNYRAFCFITFADPDVVNKICGEEHTVKGTSVSVSVAVPKSYHKKSFKKDRDSDRGRFIPPFRDQRSFNNQGGNNVGPMAMNNLGSLMAPAFFAAALSQAANFNNMGNFPNGSNIGNGRSSMSNNGNNMDMNSRNLDFSRYVDRESQLPDYSRNADRESRSIDYGRSLNIDSRSMDFGKNADRDIRPMDYSSSMGRGSRNMDDYSRNVGGESRNLNAISNIGRESRNLDYSSNIGRESRNLDYTSNKGREIRTLDYGGNLGKESRSTDYSDRAFKGQSSRFNDRIRNERDMPPPTFNTSGGKTWGRQQNRDINKDDDLFRFRYAH